MSRSPLTRSQEALRGWDVRDMSIEQLRDWIAACEKMEVWVKPAKARRSWKLGFVEATEELASREAIDEG
ncbi:MAG: hypothetical protein C0483_06075 [Pirellula sp.]|nr:hypothetical protein [Pirellula sp.]